MFKITVQIKGLSDYQYFTTLVPIVGDRINVGTDYYTVSERVIFTDNPNFIIIKVA